MSNIISSQMKLKIKVGQTLLRTINQQGYEAYFVGGFVRDMLLHRFFQLDDIDIATNMPMAAIQEQFSVVYQAEKFGMICVGLEGFQFEVTQFRSDGVYTDGRRPEQVSWARTLVEDVKRRDFTINGLAMDAELTVFDYVNGQNDLAKKVLRTIGEANLRFQEDCLRIVRALRFASNLDLTIEQQTKEAMLKQRQQLKSLPLARIRLEIKKTEAFERLLPLLRQFELFDYHPAFFGLSKIDSCYDAMISSWEDFCFFQVFVSDNRLEIYQKLEFGKQTRHYYEHLMKQCSSFQDKGQTAWWNYQLNGDTRVFKYLALLYKRPYNEYMENYQSQKLKTWADIDFDMQTIRNVPKKQFQKIKMTIAFAVISGCVENQANKIKVYIQEVYGWE